MDYEGFKTQIYKLTKINLSAYKERQMKRRIDAIISKYSLKSYDEFLNAIKTKSELFEEFVNYLTINVSEFYRNPEQWEILEKEIFPYLIKENGTSIKIWSAACSTGDEPYSLVMLLTKFLALDKIKVLATDIDEQAIEKAKAGIYNEKSLEGLPKDFRDRHFSELGNKLYKINDNIKNCVEFKKHNLLEDIYPINLDIIICRNVLIYFTEEAKDKIYTKFSHSLKKGGILFIGSTEQIMQSKNYGLSTVKSFFYKKQ